MSDVRIEPLEPDQNIAPPRPAESVPPPVEPAPVPAEPISPSDEGLGTVVNILA